ncbi:MAG TPA: methylmalonyl-CoA mutase family protein [Caulobacteraceae bacterium]
MSADTPLADDFPPATEAQWLGLVARTLKGASADSLVSPGPDGLEILPLYEAASSSPALAAAPRGGERPWDIRTHMRHPIPARAHDAIIEDLAGGAASIVIAVDGGGGEGVAVGSAEALAQILDEVLIDVAPVALDAGFLGPKAGDWLSAAAKGSPAAPLAFHLDPLSAFAVRGTSPGPIENHLIAAATLAARLAPIHPRASFFLASGTVAHEAGATPAQELAFALASALAYAKALTWAGLDAEQALATTVIGLTVDADPLISIAKLRAARMAWARLSGALGAPMPARIEARSSRRMLTRTEPWSNMIRLTAASAAAAIGGADAIILGAFTDALGLPTAFARRMARNTQLILMDEGHLGAVADPTAGSGAFEALSVELARAAWARFNAIEAAGGLIGALREGVVAGEVGTAREQLKADLAAGALRLIGVTDFQAAESRAAAIEEAAFAAPPAPEARLPGPDSTCPPLTPIALEDLAR